MKNAYIPTFQTNIKLFKKKKKTELCRVKIYY